VPPINFTVRDAKITDSEKRIVVRNAANMREAAQ
jgi:hypothetical protein